MFDMFIARPVCEDGERKDFYFAHQKTFQGRPAFFDNDATCVFVFHGFFRGV